MKISHRQLSRVLTKLRYDLVGYQSSEQDFDLDINITQEDIGVGQLADCMTIAGSKPVDDDAPERQYNNIDARTLSIEIYPSDMKLDPVARKTEVYKIKD